MHRCDGVRVVVRGTRHHRRDSRKVHVLGRVLGQEVRRLTPEPRFPSRVEVVGTPGNDEGGDVQIAQGLRRIDAPGRGPRKHHSARACRRQPQLLGEPADTQAVNGHRADDDEEHQRHEPVDLARHPRNLVSERHQLLRPLGVRLGNLLGLLPDMTGGLAELHREDRRHRRGHDSSRSHECHQDPLLTSRLGSRQPQHHRHRPNDQHEQGDEDQASRKDVADLGWRHSSGQHDEQHPDEQHLQMLLELDDGLELEIALVCQVDAQHRHGDQPGLLTQEVRPDAGTDGDSDEDHALQEVRNEVTPHHGRDDPPDRRCEQQPDQQGQRQVQHTLSDRGPTDAADGLVDQQGQDRAQRIDDDALPPQQGAHPSGGPQLTQDRVDDRRTGDDEDRAQQQGNTTVEPQCHRRQGDENPRDPCGDGAQPKDWPSQVTNFAELEPK